MPQPPTIQEDGTITAVVAESAETVGNGSLLRLHLPITTASALISGRYFLARCGGESQAERFEQWQFYLRKPLFAVAHRPTSQDDGMPVAEWSFYLTQNADVSSTWLHEVTKANPINLLGPFGNGFQLHPLAQRMLILFDSERSLTMLAFIEQALDAGKKVAVLIKGDALKNMLISRLSLAVEVHYAADAMEWETQLMPLLRWADQLCTTLPQNEWLPLARLIRQHRSRFDSNFAQVLVEADLVCAVGACLACVVPLADEGLTRACIHGPVMDLAKLVKV
ncbi:MAG: hypothetical protein U0175_31120 [Caldilineaceae bacterium]